MNDPVAGPKDIETSYELAPFTSDHVLETARVARETLSEGRSRVGRTPKSQRQPC